MLAYEIQADIEAIEKNSALYQEPNFDNRAAAIDYIEFNIVDRIEGLLQSLHPPKELIPLKQYAERVKRQLQDIDDALFQRLRADIRIGGCTGTAFKTLIDEYVGRDSSASQPPDDIGYDSVDVFINRLLLIRAVPIETRVREPEMVPYQPTPARIIFEL